MASAIAFGYSAGRNIRQRKHLYYYIIACAAAVLALVLVLYQFCEARECYYIGPDGLGEVRLFVLLLGAAVVGLIRGYWASSVNLKKEKAALSDLTSSSDPIQSKSLIHPLLASTMVAIFVGIYPASLLYDVPSEPVFRVLLFLYYVTVPFFLAGLIASQVDRMGRQKWAICSAALAQIVLFFLFEVPAFSQDGGNGSSLLWSMAQIAVAIVGSATSAIVGLMIGRAYYCRYRDSSMPFQMTTGQNVSETTLSMASSKGIEKVSGKLLAYLSVLIFFCFGIWAVHPSLLAPIDLLPSVGSIDGYPGENGNPLNIVSPIPQPMYYMGAASSEPYFNTKRVEVNVDFTSLYHDSASINNTPTGNDNNNYKDDFVVAGIGAQSPNCCKDGLDYGYRADILFTHEGSKYLVARAWETCDQNAACSGFPWRSLMHEAIVPIVSGSNNTTKSDIDIAMAWAKDSRTVDWYYRITDSNDGWIKYSTFTAPAIENPFFNVGAITINSLFSTENVLIKSLFGNVNFFQVGMAASSSSSDGSSAFSDGKIDFKCAAYYDNNSDGGGKQCFTGMFKVPAGESEWKVLWGWGSDRLTSAVRTDNSTISFAY